MDGLILVDVCRFLLLDMPVLDLVLREGAVAYLDVGNEHLSAQVDTCKLQILLESSAAETGNKVVDLGGVGVDLGGVSLWVCNVRG